MWGGGGRRIDVGWQEYWCEMAGGLIFGGRRIAVGCPEIYLVPQLTLCLHQQGKVLDYLIVVGVY